MLFFNEMRYINLHFTYLLTYLLSIKCAKPAEVVARTKCLRLLPPPKEGGYVFTSACLSVRLSVCLFVRLLTKLRNDFDEFFRKGGNSRLDLGADPNHDPGIPKGFFIYYCDSHKQSGTKHEY